MSVAHDGAALQTDEMGPAGWVASLGDTLSRFIPLHGRRRVHGTLLVRMSLVHTWHLALAMQPEADPCIRSTPAGILVRATEKSDLIGRQSGLSLLY